MRKSGVMKLLNIFLTCVGINFLMFAKDKKYVRFNYYWQLINLIFCTCVVISEIVYLGNYTYDIAVFTEVMSTAVTMVICFFKISSYMYHRDELKCIVYLLIYQDYSTEIPIVSYFVKQSVVGTKAAELLALMADSDKYLMNMISLSFKMYGVPSIGTVTIFHAMPIIMSYLNPVEYYRKLPYGLALPWDVNISPNYELTYVLNVWAGMHTILIYVGTDIIFALLVGKVIRQLRIISFILENSDELVGEIHEINTEEWDRGCTEVLTSCAEHYAKLKRLIRRLNVIHQICFTIQALLTSVIMCVCMYKISLNMFAAATIKYYPFQIMMLMMLAVGCGVVQQLENESERLRNCLSYGWWLHSRRYQSIVKMLHWELQHTLVMHIWGSIPFSMSTCGSVVKTSVSYLALLLSMEDTNK